MFKLSARVHQSAEAGAGQPRLEMKQMPKSVKIIAVMHVFQ